MFRALAENQLILPDIADVLQDYTSIQVDIDSTKIKAAALIAQNIDIKRLIERENLDRVIGISKDSSEADRALLQLIIPPLCYFTYSRCLLMFQGVLTDSGYIVEAGEEAVSRNAAKALSTEIKGIAETLMQDVIDFLEDERPGEQLDDRYLTPRIRVFGGEESNFNPSIARSSDLRFDTGFERRSNRDKNRSKSRSGRHRNC